jgi:hypothetical protein
MKIKCFLKMLVDEVAASFQTFPPVEKNNGQTQGPDVNDFGYLENVSNFSATTDSWEAEFNEPLIRTCQERWTRLHTGSLDLNLHSG